MHVALLLLLAACAAPAVAGAAPHDAVDYERQLARFAAERARLAVAYRAPGADKGAIRAAARRAVLGFIDDVVFTAWAGTPWGLGPHSTATRPHQPGKVVGCSYFVTSVLQNAGLELSNRYHFAQAPALHIQRSLAPDASDMLRVASVPAAVLRRRIAARGDGLFVIGLHNHVGFVRVRDGEVRVVHASYTDAQVVVDEPLLTAKVIHASRRAGYFVSRLFHDDRLVDHWLRGQPVPFRGGS